MKNIVFFSVFLAVLVLTSCSVLDRNAKITYNGEELSLSDVTEMRHDFPIETEKETEKREVTLVPYGAASFENAVYWVQNGEVWHISSDCGHIKSGSEVIYGTEKNAIECGKLRLCSSCSKKTESTNQ